MHARPLNAWALTPILILILILILGLGSTATGAQSDSGIDLRQIMADPDWIGQPVQAVWWQLDGSGANFLTLRQGSEVDDWYRIELDSGDQQRIEHQQRASSDGPNPVFDVNGERALFIRDGNLFLHEPGRSQARQVSRGLPVRQALFGADGEQVYFRADNAWWAVQLESGLSWPVADLRFEADPDEDPEDELAIMQLRLFSTLAREREREQEQRRESIKAARLDATRSAPPWYLGENLQAAASSLSPDGRWLLLAIESSRHEQGRQGKMPHYVTVDGYVDIEQVRTRAGRNQPAAHQLWLLDLVDRRKTRIELDGLPAIGDDPLAELRQAAGTPALEEGSLRPVRITGMRWHPEGRVAAVQFRAIDNKDRWLATLTAEEAELVARHRLNDPAWINWAFNDFGWIPNSDDLWLLSEQSGYAHLYRIDLADDRTQALTRGEFEIHAPWFDPDGRRVLMISNASHPTEFDLYQLDLSNPALTRLTEQLGIESFSALPGDDRVLVRASESYLPPQAAMVDSSTGQWRWLTDTRSEDYQTMDWQPPQIVGIPSSHDAGQPIWSKFYPARDDAPASVRRPAVLFVHGAGYLQNTLHRWPQYFREQMFHNLLTERGYLVLDMDFRASAGYGRDWRTAIYRNMGTPELEDLIDGVRWLVDEHGADPGRIGIYGGSYGGFMAFMAMFKAPDVFAAGAALRPVTDWVHYNHPYTSNILNTPDIDPEAYARSSPIEFAEGLEGHLLITHGMLDDNVFYQDVVRLSQRLIELEKENWELASYPLERHGFRHPESWLDQYRRILRLFETTIGGNRP